MWGLDGVEKAASERGYPFQGMETRTETARLCGKIGFSGHPFVEHFKFLKRVAGEGAVARQTLPAPAQFLAELQRGDNAAITRAFYPDLDELIADIASAYRTAILAFYDAGCRSVQLDDCTWGMLCDRDYWQARQRDGEDVAATAKLFARVNREAIAGLPDDLIVTTHVCRGNYHSTWASSGGYEPVAETLFGIEGLDAFYLEFDTDRAGDFTPLRHLQGGQVVLGLFSSKTGELEDKETILGRIREAAEIVDINRICLSPQCGFASTEKRLRSFAPPIGDGFRDRRRRFAAGERRRRFQLDHADHLDGTEQLQRFLDLLVGNRRSIARLPGCPKAAR
nr:5-methyltetrahydropteroyltriglutamate--homocysteine methyltransferase [Cohnella thermotolerans]